MKFGRGRGGRDVTTHHPRPVGGVRWRDGKGGGMVAWGHGVGRKAQGGWKKGRQGGKRQLTRQAGKRAAGKQGNQAGSKARRQT